MKNQITFSITQQDIAKGKRMQGDKCPAALSLKRTLRKNLLVKSVWVTTNGAEVRKWIGKKVFYKQSEELKGFIKNFDGGEIVSPITVVITKL